MTTSNLVKIAPALPLLDSDATFEASNQKGWSEIIGFHYKSKGNVGHIHFMATIGAKCEQNVTVVPLCYQICFHILC